MRRDLLPGSIGSCKLRVFSPQRRPIRRGGIERASWQSSTSTTSSSAPAPRAACSPTASVPTDAATCCCSRRGRATPISGSTCRSATASSSRAPTSTGPTSPSPSPTLNGRRVFTPRGKVLGGSSSINGLVYIRGQREDFDGWGVPGWTLRRSAALLQEVRGSSARRERVARRRRPDQRLRPPDRHELCDAFIASAMTLGIPRNDDFNGATQEGTGYYQATSRNGPALQHRGRLPASRARPHESERRSRCARDENCVRRQTRGRSRIRSSTDKRTKRRGTRSDPLRRHVQLAAAAAALGRGPACAARASRHPGRARCAGRGRGSAGSFLLPHVLALHAADHAERRHAERVAAGEDRLAVPALPARPAHGQRRLRGAHSCARGRS